MRYLLTLTLCLLLLAPPAWAALVQDAVSTGNKNGTGTVLTVPHTATGTDVNGLLLTCGTIETSGATTMASVVWDPAGVNEALTELVTLSNGANVRTTLWYRKNPTPGTKNVVLTTSGAQITTAHNVTYTGVDQTTTFGTPVTNIVTGTGSSVDVTSLAGEIVADCLAVNDDGLTETIGASQTMIGTEQSNGTHTALASTEPGAATVTMSWTWTDGSLGLAHAAVPIKPVAAATSHNLSLMGVGQ